LQFITLRKPSRAVAVGVFGVVVLVLLGCFSPVWWERFVLASVQAPIRRVETSNRVVALTFDVDWGSTVAPQVLDILDQGQVKATFFVTGPWAGVHPEILARLHRERHEVGNRGYIIENLSGHSQAEIRQELAKAQELICETTGYVPAFSDRPGGTGTIR
jgi:peptidoglycan/xylan/chitin deacetylase (PgdA/CDA1 family)